jgi:hypothetical protein
MRRHAIIVLAVLAALPAARTGAQTQAGSASGGSRFLPAAAANPTSERGGDPGGFVLINETADLPNTGAGACIGAEGDSRILIRAHRYDLNSEMGRLLHGNILQYTHPRTTLEQRRNTMYERSTNEITVTPPRRMPIEGGEAIVQEVVDNSNCNAARNFTVHRTFVAAYWIGGGGVAEIDLTVMGAKPATETALKYIDEVVRRLRAATW